MFLLFLFLTSKENGGPIQGNRKLLYSHTFNNCSYAWHEANKGLITQAKEDRLWKSNIVDFCLIKKTKRTGIVAFSSQPNNDESKNDESYDLSVKDAPSIFLMDAFQIDMRAAFE